MTFYCLVRRVPPHFTIQPDAKYEVNKNADLNITCVAVGSPMPFVKWREGVTDITPENDVPIGKNSFLNDKKNLDEMRFKSTIYSSEELITRH